jgi:ADP-ribosylglycohydrolase
MEEPSSSIDEDILNRIQGSIIGMALGDALGAHVEFRPHQYMVANPVKDLVGGGTWGLEKGQVRFLVSFTLNNAHKFLKKAF